MPTDGKQHNSISVRKNKTGPDRSRVVFVLAGHSRGPPGELRHHARASVTD